MTKGEEARRAVLGDAHVDRSLAGATAFDRPFQDFATDVAWGRLWADDTLTRRERSLVTLGILAATGNPEEFALHVRATANTGATPAEVMQVILHAAAYAGIPRANTATRIAREVYAEMGVDL
ncbi:4-carboxymuconolactone decarboxylase [Hasllibacter halocynthiae]|uniref:4-carboxymuconolactone decarboxylase n=1 Tax=Hasllibacter halocynthiae TaxID=595589 RepID=A0A2T0X6Q9_9RHOB|nr:4-carboxymuconolactone decarboxylase [Hasllibacter halocynthiae]PRY94616.1 4-carboxymuconolactone decarboxylase [Hasllibacter halocynthiae]